MTLVLPPAPPELEARYRRDGFWKGMTLPHLLESLAAKEFGRPAIRHPGGTVSYGQLAGMADRFAGGLAKLGIKKGDVVAVQLPNIPEFIIAYLGIVRLGAVMQTLHMPYRDAELRFLLRHSGAKAAIGLGTLRDQSPAGHILALKPELAELAHVIAIGPGAEGAVVFAELAGAVPLPGPSTVTEDDPMVVLYTSGTTADPKGVPIRHRNFVGNALVSVPELKVTPADVILSAAPMTHLYGLFALHLTLAGGACAALLPMFTPDALAQAVETLRPTCLFTAPAHMAACMEKGLFDRHDFSSVRFACLSGSTVPESLARAVDDRLANGVAIQLWGMSELQAGTYCRPDDPAEVRLRTAGGASPGTALRVVDDAGAVLGPMSDGRLQVRGPSLFSGYLNNPQATARAFDAEGWFDTGDTAMLSAGGHLIVTGRTKEIINRGGVKFSPVDVEVLIEAMPEVSRAALVPFPDPVLGERACAFVVPAEGMSVTLEAIVAHLDRHQVAKFKWPERLELIDAMPLTPTQKVMRGRLTDRLKETKT